MTKNNDLISRYQIMVLIIMTVISVGVFSLPADITKQTGTDGWITILIAGFLNIIAALIIVKLNSKFPGKTFAEYSQIIIGTFAGKAITLIFAIYLLLVIAFQVRAFTEVIKMLLLFRTPTEVIMLSLILICTYVTRGGVECVARINELLFPILFIPFFIILLFSVPSIEIDNLLPIMQTPPIKIITAIPATAISFGGIEFGLYYLGFVKEPQKAYRAVAMAVGFITFFFLIVTLLCVAAFGVTSTPDMIWPLVSLLRTINFPGLFIERLEGFIIPLWMMTVFTTLVSSYFIVSYSLSKVIGTREQKQYVVPLTLVIYYLALQPESLPQLFEWSNLVFPTAIYLHLYLLPVVMLIIARMRKKGV